MQIDIYNELDQKRLALGELFLKHGLTPEVVKESQALDKLVVMEQRRNLEETRRLEAC